MKIKDLGKIVTGKTPDTKKTEFFGDEYPFVTPSDISSYDVYHIQNTERGLSEKGYLNQKSKLLPPKTVCYVCIGSTIGKICLTKKLSFTNQQLNNIIVDQSKYVPEYIYYRLRYETPRIQSIASGTGSGKAIYNKTAFEDYQLEIHDYPLQRKIASILSAYDDLIENNTHRIQILEEMAQLIYQEWFVNFRFPGYEKVKLINSELGKIPEGWSVEQLDKYVDFERGVEPGSDNYEKNATKENIPFLRVGDLGNRSIEIFVDLSLTKNKIINEDDIAVSMDGTPGIVKIGLFGCYSTGIRKLVIKNNVMKKSFLYFLMISEHIQNIIKAHSKGTTILHASEAIKNMNFILPANDLMVTFDSMVSPMIKEILSFNKKNKILRETRDLLLPKLISGELDISDLDIVIRE
ncbi:MAG: restriction endonuclease subunit S [Bacteroidales bacterium]|nr:restriction endonuclease subunit S [Bacteroidales bacterium]